MKGKLKFSCFVFLLLNYGLVSTGFTQSTDSVFWWNDAIFYEVFVRSFKDSDGDGNGDLKGLIQKLDYLNDGNPSTHNDLGVTGIWLMPIQQSPSYHGYDVTDYRTVEADYGTNEDFMTLMTEAHKRGIKVIVDYVMNHTSSQHPWFQASIDPLSDKRDWYIWQNPNPNFMGPWSQQVWYPKNGSNYYAIFWSEMPDLNYRAPAVKAELFDAARFWLEDMNADGFRLDASRYILEDSTVQEDTHETLDFWGDFRAYYKSVKSDAFAVGEAWAATDIAKTYVNDTTLDYCFEFDLASALLSSANGGNASALKTQVDKVVTSYPFLQYGTFLSNHDQNRVMDVLGNNVAKAKVAADLLLTLPGVSYMYYGEEIGMNGSGADENKRRPLQWDNTAQAGFTVGTPWETVNSDFTTKNIVSQQYDINSLWSRYKNLIALRYNQQALRRGSYKAITATNSHVFSFLRQYGNETILVVSNLSLSAVASVQLTSSQATILPGDYTLVELQGGTSVPVTVNASGDFSWVWSSIPATGTLIYKLLKPSETWNDVVFEVDMNKMIANGDFNPSSEYVDIVASFNDFGTDSITRLYDGDDDGVYAVTISNLGIGSKVDYKYQINGVNDGREEFANSSYVREYIVLEGQDTLLDSYQKLDVTITALQTPASLSASIYPVPSSKELFLEFSSAMEGAISYQIEDLMGVERASSSFTSYTTGVPLEIPLEGLNTGVYLLVVTAQEGKQAFRIVVQK